MRHLYQMLWILLFFSTAACATIGTGEPSITDTPRPAKRAIVPVEGAMGAVEQDGSTITVQAWHVCDTVEKRSAVRTTTTKAINKSASLDWTLVGIGLGSAALGTVLVVDANNVFPNDDQSRTYNPVGPTPARVIGYGLIGTGAVLGTIILVDVIRANRTTVDTREVEFPAKRLGRGRPCPDKRHAGAKVMVQYLGQDYSLGETDSKGKLAADLGAVFPDDLVFHAHDLRAEVLVVAAEGKPLSLGKVDLKEVYETRQARVWSLVAPACETPLTATSCAPVEEFLRQYPSGPNAAQARALLARMKPRLDAMADDVAWHGIKPDDCATKVKGETLSDLNYRCRPLRDYLARFPRGSHAAEARAALDKGEARIALMEAAERKKEAEEQRRAKEKAAAEERREREAEAAELRRQQAKEKREREEERSRCRAECKMGCSNMYRYSKCVWACIELRCQ